MSRESTKNRARNKQIVIRSDEKEFEKIKSKVNISWLSQNEFLLKAILDKDIIQVDGIHELMMEFKKIGNNLNQLTKLAHQGKVNCSKELELMNKEMSGSWQSLKLLIQSQK